MTTRRTGGLLRPGYVGRLGCLLLALGCADIHHLATLRSALSRRFQDPGTGVSLTDGLYLTVTFVNGPWPDAPCDRQVPFALRVASYVRDNYQDFTDLQSVSIAFTRRISGESMATTSTHPPFRFARTALQTGSLAADSASAVALCELDAIRPSADSP